MTTGSGTDTDPSLRLRLPGEWWNIPLTDPDTARASVRRLARQQLGPADDRARLRREYEQHLTAGLEKAIEGRGRSFHLAIRIVPGVPIPATITVYAPDQRMTPAIGASRDAVADVLRRGLDAVVETWRTEATVTSIEHRDSAVLRVHRRETIEPAGVRHPVDVLVVDYWLTVPGTKRVALVHCSTPLADLENVMLQFFDSLARAARWERTPRRRPEAGPVPVIP